MRLVDGFVNKNGTIISLLRSSGGGSHKFCQYRIGDARGPEVFEETCGNGWSSILQGRVEICTNNEYQSVCDDRWDALEARVVCNQLQHPSSGNNMYSVPCLKTII